MKSVLNKFTLLAMGVLLTPCLLIAQGPPKPSTLSNPLALTMVIIIFALLLVIGLLASVVIGAAKMYLSRYQEDAQKTSTVATKLVTVLVAVFISFSAMAQDAAAAATDAAPVEEGIAGLSMLTFYTLLSVIGLEIIILLVLLYNLKLLLQKESLIYATAGAEAVTKENICVKWWDKLNSFKPIKDERDIDLGHDYDGIRELDNKLPPWWLYGFYVCVIFAGIYLWQYHVSKTSPLPEQELQIAMEKAEKEKEAYLKKAANNIDENSVKLLTEAADIEAGKKIYTTSCVACHLADGGGQVGPNLTDEYWLHGGSVQDIFKTIKYGWPEKG
ncbi:MAG: cbb3-type cytochrome c oxidase N-terminal domain-containing protein, partial [Chitinophagaceae bacterium]